MYGIYGYIKKILPGTVQKGTREPVGPGMENLDSTVFLIGGRCKSASFMDLYIR